MAMATTSTLLLPMIAGVFFLVDVALRFHKRFNSAHTCNKQPVLFGTIHMQVHERACTVLATYIDVYDTPRELRLQLETPVV